MHKIRIIATFIAALATQQVFAHSDNTDKSCNKIADTCEKAGFVREESANKGLWQNCMRPILLGHTVSGVTIEAAEVKSCRTHKIKKLKTELKDLKKAS